MPALGNFCLLLALICAVRALVTIAQNRWKHGALMPGVTGILMGIRTGSAWSGS